MPIRLSGKEIVRALNKDGWELERITGSHHVMRHADGRHVSVPVHGARPLPAGTLASICRQVGPHRKSATRSPIETDPIGDSPNGSGTRAASWPNLCGYRLHWGEWPHLQILP